jgi:hypothetical protein
MRNALLKHKRRIRANRIGLVSYYKFTRAVIQIKEMGIFKCVRGDIHVRSRVSLDPSHGNGVDRGKIQTERVLKGRAKGIRHGDREIDPSLGTSVQTFFGGKNFRQTLQLVQHV